MDGALEVAAGALLDADLHNPMIASRCFDHEPPFADAIGNRLFNVNIFAGITGIDSHQRMPMIRRRDDYSLKILPLQYLPVVPIDLSLISSQLARAFGIRSENIADSQDGHLRIALEVDKVHLSHTAAADEAHTDAFVGC
jgi:hypothetical protein